MRGAPSPSPPRRRSDPVDKRKAELARCAERLVLWLLYNGFVERDAAGLSYRRGDVRCELSGGSVTVYRVPRSWENTERFALWEAELAIRRLEELRCES